MRYKSGSPNRRGTHHDGTHERVANEVRKPNERDREHGDTQHDERNVRESNPAWSKNREDHDSDCYRQPQKATARPPPERVPKTRPVDIT